MVHGKHVRKLVRWSQIVLDPPGSVRGNGTHDTGHDGLGDGVPVD